MFFSYYIPSSRPIFPTNNHLKIFKSSTSISHNIFLAHVLFSPQIIHSKFSNHPLMISNLVMFKPSSITAQGIPEPSFLRGSTLGTRAAKHKGCNWGMQIDWWLRPIVVFGHTFSGIIWRMPQKWSQFNCMTLSWWPRHEILSVTLHYITLLVLFILSRIVVGKIQLCFHPDYLISLSPSLTMDLHYHEREKSKYLKYPQSHKMIFSCAQSS